MSGLMLSEKLLNIRNCHSSRFVTFWSLVKGINMENIAGSPNKEPL